jgi:hypothetical protein
MPPLAPHIYRVENVCSFMELALDSLIRFQGLQVPAWDLTLWKLKHYLESGSTTASG